MGSAIFVGVATAAVVFWLCAKVFDMPVIGFFLAVGMGLYGAMKAGGGSGSEPEPESGSGSGSGGAELRMGFRVDPSAGQSNAGPEAGIPNMFDVPELMRLGRWEQARIAMEKIAYSMSRESPENQERFKELATQFAAVEPFYQRHVARVVEAVRQNPGIKQSAIYERIPDMNKQDVRYVLYFADQLQQVHRVKKGNTYILNVGPSGVSLLR